MLNKAINGDCYVELRKIENNSIDLVLIDPPYLISKDSSFKATSENTPESLKKKYNISIDFGEWDKEELDWDLLFKEYYRILKKGGTLITFYDVWKANDIKKYAIDNKFKQPRIGNWVKCIAGSSELYIKNNINEHKKIFLKDIYRHSDLSKLSLWDGTKWNRINNVILNSNPQDILKITLESGEIIKATGEHIFIDEMGNEIIANNLKKGDVLKTTTLPNTNNINKAEMLSENMAWFIGLYLAEGSMSNHKIQISSNTNETFRIDRIKELCSEYDGKYHIYIKPNSNTMTINVSSIIIEAYLNKYLKGNDCYSKAFTNSFFNLSNKLIEIAFMSYLNADGGKDLKNKRYRIGFTGKNRQLERDIRTICAKLNLRVTIKMDKIKNTITNKIHPVLRGSVYLSTGRRFIPSRIVNIENIEINNSKTKYFDIILEDKPNIFSLSSGIILHNCNPVPINSKNNYLSNATEYFFTFVKGGKPTFNSEYDNGVYKYPLCHGKERLQHPTQKPLELIKDLISKHSNEGDVILDTFAGTGTTAVASILLNREYIVIEKEDKYFRMLEERIDNTLKYKKNSN